MSDCTCAQCVLKHAQQNAEPGRPGTLSPSQQPDVAMPRMCVQCHHVWFPLDGWEPPGGTAALIERVPVELRPLLQVLAYIVCEVEAAGPVARLALPEVDDQGRIVAALVDAGLIETHPSPSGLRRWTRTEKGDESDD
ncbi:hypothetical protein MU582_03335 [Nocardioidaceae bacterium SCSIO 66511]|nr:hypothetical protein MU582_03335 [Nocardioidaceae bacterium SCSIO 66511]